MANRTIDELFTYHSPTPEQQLALVTLRAKAKELAELIDVYVPLCDDKRAAMLLLRQSIMTANAAIVLDGLSYRSSLPEIQR